MSDEQGQPELKKDENLNLKVKSPNGDEVIFKVKQTTPFHKLMTAYCKRTGTEFESTRFMFDGQRITGEQTPKDLNMEDEDEIDAMVTQVGGSNSSL